MHEEKIALVRQQIRSLAQAVRERNIKTVCAVACGGSLATLYPFSYILSRETAAVATVSINAAEFVADPPRFLGGDTLVILNSQSWPVPRAR